MLLLLLFITETFSDNCSCFESNIRCSDIIRGNGKLFALLVGVDGCDCSDLVFRRRVGASKDVRELGRLLCKQGYIVKSLKNESATHDAVLEWFLRLANECSIDSRLLFYFSGHGTVKHINSHQSETSDTTDFIMVLHTSKYKKEMEFISSKNIEEIFNKSKALQRILIIDACYAGDAKQPTLAALNIYNPYLPEAFSFVYSAWSQPVYGRIHTIALLEGLLGAADSSVTPPYQGKVEGIELKKYLITYLGKTFIINSSDTYKPIIEIKGDSNFVFVNWRKDRKCVSK